MNKESLTIKEASSFINSELLDNYPAREIRKFTEMIFEHLLNFSPTDILTKNHTNLSNSQILQIKEIVNQLRIHKPVQYILGEAWFYGLRLTVTPDVLIPRPETEELVRWIVDNNDKIPVSVIDIGTGSGCIAIALALNLPLSAVVATDISERSVRIAELNAMKSGAEIKFIIEDIFNPVIVKSGKFDILVSNPPYVTESEKQLIDRNVLNYEPLGALFVPDMQALKYYSAIATVAKEILNPGGKLFFEINESKADQIREMLTRMMFSEIETRKDINGKYRMVRAVL